MIVRLNPKNLTVFTHSFTPVHKTVGILGNSVIHRAYNIIFLLKNLFLRRSKQRGFSMADWYLWIKAAHIISVIAWMAGLFYLPRLYVYHVERADLGLATLETFAVMERRLLKAIMNPAMIATWVFGLALVGIPGVVDWSMAWPWVKAASVIAMTIFHMWLGGARKRLADGSNRLTGRDFRIANEVPTLLLIAIVISVIVKF
jgi:putative membrane protein